MLPHPLSAHIHVPDFDHGDPHSGFHTPSDEMRESAIHPDLPVALRSPFSEDIPAAVSSPAALCESSGSAYLLFFNGLFDYTICFLVFQLQILFRFFPLCLFFCPAIFTSDHHSMMWGIKKQTALTYPCSPAYPYSITGPWPSSGSRYTSRSTGFRTSLQGTYPHTATDRRGYAPCPPSSSGSSR